MEILILSALTLALNASIQLAENYDCGAESNATLCEMFLDDQVMLSSGVDQDTFQAVTQDRIALIAELAAQGEMETPRDFFHAAVIHQHSREPIDWVLANIYASTAARLNPDDPTYPQIMAASWDRLALHLTEKQVFQTHFSLNEQDEMCVRPRLTSGSNPLLPTLVEGLYRDPMEEALPQCSEE